MTDEVKQVHSNMSPTIGKLVEALSKAQAKFDHAKKEVKNDFFKSKYADLASVIDAVRIPLSENGLAVIQTTGIVAEKVVLTTLLAHTSGEWMRAEYPINPIKQDPQGFGSALTYARRYCFSSITGIASEDDDDANDGSRIFKTAKQRTKLFNDVKEELLGTENMQELASIWKFRTNDIAKLRQSDEQIYDELEKIKDELKAGFETIDQHKKQLGEHENIASKS